MEKQLEILDLTDNQQSENSIKYPIRQDAFDISDEEKMAHIKIHFTEIMSILGLDLTDDSLKETPKRLAKMYVKEVFSGLNPLNKPSIKLFENNYSYNEILVEKNITLFSYCEHHFVPIIGKVHVAYISSGQVIGLSKINRLVNYYSKRPQVQERLTKQILAGLKEALQSENVAVIIDAAHLCVASRGVEDTNSTKITAAYSGEFLNEKTKTEFMNLIR